MADAAAALALGVDTRQALANSVQSVQSFETLEQYPTETINQYATQTPTSTLQPPNSQPRPRPRIPRLPEFEIEEDRQPADEDEIDTYGKDWVNPVANPSSTLGVVERFDRIFSGWP
jgi:hypothetical protein